MLIDKITKKLFRTQDEREVKKMRKIVDKINAIEPQFQNYTDGELSAKTAEFKEKYDVVEKSDIVISATSAPHLILEKDKMGKILSDGKKRFFLDLAVPRDIETSIGEASNTMLYHLDDIWEEYNKNVKKRDKVVDEFYYIIDEQYKETIEKLLKREKYLKK